MKFTTLSVAYADLCAELDKECFAPMDAWSARDFREMLQSDGTGRIVTIDDEPAGLIVVRRVCDEGEILTVCVRPQFRKRGLGGRLLDVVLEEDLKECERVFLEVETTKEAALALYKSRDFEICGLRKNYYAQGRHAHLMVKKPS